MKVAYKKKYEVFSSIAIATSVIAIGAVYSIISLYKIGNDYKKQVENLRNTQEIIVMPIDGCNFMEQLQNSNDSTIRWTINATK